MHIRDWEKKINVLTTFKEFTISHTHTHTHTQKKEHTLPMEVIMTCLTCHTHTCIISAGQTHIFTHTNLDMMDDTIVKTQRLMRGRKIEREREVTEK